MLLSINLLFIFIIINIIRNVILLKMISLLINIFFCLYMKKYIFRDIGILY